MSSHPQTPEGRGTGDAGSDPAGSGPDAGLTHLDARGQARMVDVGAKPATARRARARAVVELGAALVADLFAHRLAKGEALAVARVAGIAAAKETARLIPLCHPLGLDAVEIEIGPAGEDAVEILAEARCTGPTGVEMEAMTAASVAALTLYDMCKARRRGITIRSVALLEKSGGRSGTWVRGAGDGDDDA